ncbi:MAG: phospholipase D-like domain-containing protein [Thermodesulfobacteriota bacterium]
MAKPVIGKIGRMAPLAVLLLLAPALAWGQGESKVPPADPAERCDIRLLKDQEYFSALLDEIGRARQEIALTMFFFKTNGFRDHWPDRIVQHLREAVRRGVRVEAVMERGKEGENVSEVNADTSRRLKAAGIRVCMDAPDRTMHTKMIVIDRRTLFIGSHNLTQSALKYNSEVSVRIESPRLAEEAIRYMKAICR